MLPSFCAAEEFEEYIVRCITDIMDTLQKENLILKNKNLELQEQVAILEKAFHNQSQQWHRKDEAPQKTETHTTPGELSLFSRTEVPIFIISDLSLAFF